MLFYDSLFTINFTHLPIIQSHNKSYRATYPPTQNQVLLAHHSIFQVFLTFRPWHDALVIAQSHAITLINKKGGLGGWWKARPKVKLHWLITPMQNSKKLEFKIQFNWFDRIHVKLILLTLISTFFFFKTNFNWSYVLVLNIFSITTQWGFCEYVLSKKIKTDIFNKSRFANRKLIITI